MTVLPFVPGDSIFEAFRLASVAGIPTALVDVDLSQVGEKRSTLVVTVGPEFAARPGAGYFAAADALNAREESLTSDLAREAAMAAALADLMARHRSVLWVGGLAHWSRVVERIWSGDVSAPPVACASRRRFERARLEASALIRLAGVYPAMVAEFARAPSGFEPFEAMRTLLHEAAAPGLDSRWGPCESSAAIDLARTGLYARNLAASARIGEQPQLSELVLAASATIGPRYAARLFAVATEVPASSLKEAAALDPLTYEVDPESEGSERMVAGFSFRGRRLSAEPWSPPEWPILDAPDPEQLARAAHAAEYEKLPNAGAGEKFLGAGSSGPGSQGHLPTRKPDSTRQVSGRQGFYWGAYPPDETEYEAFVEYALRHASVDPGEAHVVPFTTGLRDGIDVRSTVRRWHEDALYVREETGRRRRFRNGAIDWTGLTEASDVLQGERVGGWNDPDSSRVGSASREVEEATTLATYGEAVVTRREREWSLITLDAPNFIVPRRPGRTFFDAVIKGLLDVQGGPLDDVYSWLDTMFRFCAGKPFVYYSRYRPSAQIYALARAQRVDMVWCALGRLPRELVERHRTFRQLWLSGRPREGASRAACDREWWCPCWVTCADAFRSRSSPSGGDCDRMEPLRFHNGGPWRH